MNDFNIKHIEQPSVSGVYLSWSKKIEWKLEYFDYHSFLWLNSTFKKMYFLMFSFAESCHFVILLPCLVPSMKNFPTPKISSTSLSYNLLFHTYEWGGLIWSTTHCRYFLLKKKSIAALYAAMLLNQATCTFW